MSRELGPAPLHRCLTMWALASAALVVLGGWLLPGLVGAAAAAAQGPPPPFDEALVRCCEAVLLGCSAWLWLVTCLVSADAARGRTLPRAGVPAWLRRLVLVGCGAALASGLTAPAHSDPGPSAPGRSTPPAAVQGLPLPDRATAAGHVGSVLARQVSAAQQAQPSADPLVVVRPGDTLWDLADGDLPATASDRAIAQHWQEIYRVNRRVIGPDPDLIHPAQQLRLPRR